MSSASAGVTDPAVAALCARVEGFAPTAWKLSPGGGVAVDGNSRRVCLTKHVKGRLLVRQLTGDQILSAEVREEAEDAEEPVFVSTLCSILLWAGIFYVVAMAIIDVRRENSFAPKDQQVFEDLRRSIKESSAVQFGLIGALVGAVLGPRRTTRQVCRLSLAITTTETEFPLHEVPLLTGRYAVGSREHAAAMTQALYLKALLAAVSRAAAE